MARRTGSACSLPDSCYTRICDLDAGFTSDAGTRWGRCAAPLHGGARCTEHRHCVSYSCYGGGFGQPGTCSY